MEGWGVDSDQSIIYVNEGVLTGGIGIIRMRAMFLSEPGVLTFSFRILS